MQLYTLGFLFDAKCKQVALIRKDHPWQQEGKLNGVGGKVLPNEETRDAMSREFTEEAGRVIHPESWHPFFIEEGEGYKIYGFRSILMGVKLPFRTDTSEPVAWFDIDKLHSEKLVVGVSWMVPMALDGYLRMATIKKH